MCMDKKIELALITLLYLTTIYLWSLPYQDDYTPYGEFDATSHFQVGDYMAQTNKALVELPPFISIRYGGDNTFKPNTLWYHPPYHTNFAVIEIFGGHRIVPIYLLNTILSSSLVIILYFVMRHLYGFWPGILSALLAMFSMRDIMVYLWGQWPERIGYAFTPLVLFVFYLYVKSYINKDIAEAYRKWFALLWKAAKRDTFK